ncbi:MAG: histidine phosphatase family protein [Myxococcales bacterium]|nr:histidine phosphatase family protein [Myxococcales bacterium]
MVPPQRRLILLRHAKSDWNTDAQTDHERPINERGRKAAPRVAERLRTLGWVPQVVCSSDATRTRQTWARMQAVLGGEPQVSFARALYLAGPPEIRAAIGSLPVGVETALVLGHNPGWEDAVYALTGVRVRMTTCNAALMHLRAESWADAAARSDWAFEQVVRPKEL